MVAKQQKNINDLYNHRRQAMAKLTSNTNAAKVNDAKGVDQVDTKKPDLADETLLAYALELGKDACLIQRFSGVEEPEILQFVSKDNGEIAHFILRQWPDRVVKVKRLLARNANSRWNWTVSGGPNGEAVVFDSNWSPKEVAKQMKLALAGPAVKGRSPVIGARSKLAWVSANNSNLIVAQRRAEAVWPPVPGTVRARALELTLATKDFSMSRGLPNYQSTPVFVSAKPVLAKLKDPNYHILDLNEACVDKNASHKMVHFGFRFIPIDGSELTSVSFTYEGYAPMSVVGDARKIDKKS